MLGTSARLLADFGQIALRGTGAASSATLARQTASDFIPALAIGGRRGFRNDQFSGAGGAGGSALSQPRVPPSHMGIKCAECRDACRASPCAVRPSGEGSEDCIPGLPGLISGSFRHTDSSLSDICTCRIVPEQTAYVVERFGRYSTTLTPGIHLLIPLVRRRAAGNALCRTERTPAPILSCGAGAPVQPVHSACCQQAAHPPWAAREVMQRQCNAKRSESRTRNRQS